LSSPSVSFPSSPSTAQEGRLFKPLAFTKTFSMLFAALLGVTLVPVLMLIFVRGKITPEAKEPGQPPLDLGLPTLRELSSSVSAGSLILAAVLTMAAAVYPFNKLGKEFMPPLNEGDILLHADRRARHFSLGGPRPPNPGSPPARVPEVESVFGKAGESETATDPAPLSMIETVVSSNRRTNGRPASPGTSSSRP
jgi:Cu(I)/Ag(I) efflux system membrane protein CusA/SilA